MPFSIEITFVLLLGLVFGSFATALCWRIPRDISWISAKDGDVARSCCAHCDHALNVFDLVPLFSWLFLRGRCRYCRKAVSVRYPLIELFTALGCLGVYFVWGFTVPAFIVMAIVPLLMALLIIDLDHMILPNQLVFLSAMLAVIFLVYQFVTYGNSEAILLNLVGMFSFSFLVWFSGYVMGRVLKKEALGMGDVKFFAMAGLWLGVPYLPFYFIFSGFCGVVMGGYYQFILKKQVFPFGPALILSLYTGILLQGLEIVPLIGVQ